MTMSIKTVGNVSSVIINVSATFTLSGLQEAKKLFSSFVISFRIRPMLQNDSDKVVMFTAWSQAALKQASVVIPITNPTIHSKASVVDEGGVLIATNRPTMLSNSAVITKPGSSSLNSARPQACITEIVRKLNSSVLRLFLEFPLFALNIRNEHCTQLP